MGNLIFIFSVIALVAFVYWGWRKTKAEKKDRIEKEGQPNVLTLQYWIWRKTKEDEQARREKETKRQQDT